MDPHPSRESSRAEGDGGGYSYPVREIPERLRPREEMSRLGVRHVSDDVLLAILLRSGVRGRSVVDLARGLLWKYGSLSGLARSSVEELAGEPGMGPVKAQVLIAGLELARRLSEESVPGRRRIRTPEDAASVLREDARILDTEVFWVLNLDAKNVLKGRPDAVTSGLLDASLTHPREVFRRAIRAATAAVILVHNHPSGDCAPSAEDIRITRQLVAAGKVIDIKVLDHVVLGVSRGGDGGFCSMREQGVVEF